MGIVIREYSDAMTPAVVEFNGRLRAGGARMQFPVSPVPAWLPKIAGRTLYEEYYLALEAESIVRGGYILKYQDFWVSGRDERVTNLQLPISEGIVERAYSQVGVQLLLDALKRQPLLYCLGMGGYEEQLPRLLKAAGWSMFLVPFFFRVVHPNAFLRNITLLRRSSVRCAALDALALSGLGWLGIRTVQTVTSRRVPAVAADLADEFGDWADELWESHKDRYGMTAVRNGEVLRILYPKSDPRFLRLKITERGRLIGWAVVLDTQLSDHKQFGNMRLGSIVDAFASPDDSAKVIRAARTFLASRGVDLIVSNHSHGAWGRGFRQAGFLCGPSNFIFAASPQLARLLQASNVADADIHLNRGDGDGPINL